MMKLKIIKKGIIAMTLLALANTVYSQAISIEDAIKAWDSMTKMVVESAKLMPAEDYSFTPGDPLRSFANQLNHTTSSNIGFAQSVKAGRPSFKLPSRKNPPNDKATVVDLLEKSFWHFRGGLEKLTTADLSETVPWGRAGNQTQISRLKAILIVTSHLQREHGKTMMYLRAKGIQPAPAGSWTF